MARNSRVGGVSSWRTATNDEAEYRPSSVSKKGRAVLQTNVVVPDFPDDKARYGWEMEQWRNAILTKQKWRKWIGADENWHVGPPILPGAPVFTDKVAQRAFKKANEAGYISPRTLGERLGVGRYLAKRLMDVVRNHLDVAFVTYAHRTMKTTMWNCRMLHEDEVEGIRENMDEWRARMKKSFKSKELPPLSRRMSVYMEE